MNIIPGNLRFGNRQPVKRLEDERLMTGRGLYADDAVGTDSLWLAIARSPHAHAKILSIDTSAAKAMPGVELIITGDDLQADGVAPMPTVPIFKRPGGKDMSFAPHHILANEFARFAGEPVAAVVARTRTEAIEAAEAIAVDYDVLPAVVDPREAMKPGAPVLWAAAGDNIAAEMVYGDAKLVEDVFAKAKHTVSLDIVNQRLAPVALEPRSAFAYIEDGRIYIRAQSQMPASARGFYAGAVLHREPDQVRVLVGDLGGGFGQKSGIGSEEVLVVYATSKLNRKVAWRADRIDEFAGSTHGRDLTSKGELALDENGRILAYRVHSIGGTGAYLHSVNALIPLVLGPFVGTGTYDVPLVNWTIHAVTTNTAPTAAYRGAGRPETIFLIERLLDAAARQIGMDPVAIRKVNYVKPSQLPYTSAIGQVYDSGEFAGLLDRLVEESDWNGFGKRKAEAESRGMLYGRGIASYIEWTGGTVLTEPAKLFATADGKIILYSATQAMGQGLQTSYTQLLAAALGVPMENIEIVQGDTDTIQGFGSAGSRSLFMGGSATAQAAWDLIEKAREKAADKLEAAKADIEYTSGMLSVAGTDRSITLFDLAKDEDGSRLAVESEGKADGPSWPNGSHAVEVEIDPETGTVRVARVTSVDDVGIPMNPMIVTGQIHGGIAQGVGQALLEGVVYSDDGQLLTASFMDYAMPRAGDFPAMNVNLDDRAPCKTNALGAKGCGESGAVGAPPAVVNAVVDALSAYGVKHIDMPITAQKVWRAINGAA